MAKGACKYLLKSFVVSSILKKKKGGGGAVARSEYTDCSRGPRAMLRASVLLAHLWATISRMTLRWLFSAAARNRK